MKIYEVTSWSGFEGTIDQIIKKYGKSSLGSEQIGTKILFRGQSDAEWPLESSLERRTLKLKSFSDYYDLVYQVTDEIQSVTGKKWEIPSWVEYQKGEWFKQEKRFFDLPMYEFIVYLRHFGFPSPLLDWSLSPFIALFFATEFKNSMKDCDGALYVFIERPESYKISEGWDNSIEVLGKYVSTDKRHFIQQCEYTIAYKYVGNDYEIVNYMNVVNPKDENQDLLIKIEFPSSLKVEFRKRLFQMNINAFTLYGGEDALMDSLSEKFIELQ